MKAPELHYPGSHACTIFATALVASKGGLRSCLARWGLCAAQTENHFSFSWSILPWLEKCFRGWPLLGDIKMPLPAWEGLVATINTQTAPMPRSDFVAQWLHPETMKGKRERDMPAFTFFSANNASFLVEQKPKANSFSSSNISFSL